MGYDTYVNALIEQMDSAASLLAQVDQTGVSAASYDSMVDTMIEGLESSSRPSVFDNISAAMGNLIGIRPIIHINDEGKMLSIGKEKGRAKALARLVSYVEELGDNVKDHKVIIGHTDAYETAEEIRDMLIGKFGELDCEIVPVNPTAGSHCGPNCVGVSFHAKHR